MKRNIVIIGASGDIGKAIKDQFKDDDVLCPTRDEVDLFSNFKLHSNAPIDVIIYAAGFNQPARLIKLTSRNINETMNVNALGFLSLVQQLLPILQPHAHILAISSLFGTFGKEGRTAYTASKHALEGIVKSLAIELGPVGIKVNSLSPGYVNTKMTHKNNTPKQLKTIEQQIPMGRLAEPEEIAEVVAFLCSNNNTYITGQNIIVDGGYSIVG